MSRSFLILPLLTLLVLAIGTIALAGDAVKLEAKSAKIFPGVRLKIVPEYKIVKAGDDLRVGAILDNPTRTDHFVIVRAYLAPVREPIPIPPVTKWEKFVYELLGSITGDCTVVFVPAGQTRMTKLTVEVHPRMHGRFEVVGTARTMLGRAVDRAGVLSKITAPPSTGGVLVHGKLYELGPCRLLVTDDGHIYEPKGPKARAMFKLLDTLYPRPDGVTVLGGILENTVGCFGVELSVDLFRFDRKPGSPTGVRYRTLARGRTQNKYGGPDEEIVRSLRRLKGVFTALDAELIGARPDFRREMVAVVTTPGNTLTRIRVGRILIKRGVLEIHYTVVNAGPGLKALPAKILRIDSLQAESLTAYARPYHIVALPKYRGRIRFVRRDVKIRSDAIKKGVLRIDEGLDLGLSKKLVPEGARELEGMVGR